MRNSSAKPDGLVARLGRRRWRLLVDPPAPGDQNMALDAALLRSAIGGGPPTLRFYTWAPPAVSLGRFQDADVGIDWGYCRRRAWHAVRRPTGGRAVLHQMELTYSIVLPPDVLGAEGLRGSYCLFKAALEASLGRWVGAAGIAAGDEPRTGAPVGCDGGETGCAVPAPRRPPASCFARVAEGDIAAAGGKLVGSAQARSGRAMLQHGSILLDRDEEAWKALFGTPGALCTLRDLTGTVPEPLTLARYLARDLAAQWGIELVYEPPSGEERAATEAAASGYRLMECGDSFAAP